MDMNKFIGKDKPDAEKIPGFKLYFNESLGKWAYRPEVGYSEKYLNEEELIPKHETNAKFDDYVEGKGKNLKVARAVKNDEYYTRFQDIADELKHYKEFFKDKVVYCPCDKAFNIGRSEFFNFFIRVFNEWGIKKLIATQYCPNGDKRGYLWVVENLDKLGFNVDESEIDTYLLDGDGSFFSDECVEIAKSSDIIVTNPPFSLIDDFIAKFFEVDKKFLIIGPETAATHKTVFPLIKDDKMWYGYTHAKAFRTRLTEVEDPDTQYFEDGHVYQKFGNILWYTNLQHNKRLNDELDLFYEYSEDKYPKYDNYNAIDVSRVKLIPDGYDGKMGVPISFLNSYSPKQFRIVKFRKGDDGKDLSINGHCPFARVIIEKRKK